MAQAKRSPILGYNHNVKYRGVIFHVQTEDSGQQNPHLFTHLFHEGVIVSTRKYVYDAGSNEEAIKGLMQAQHKAVMKDLKKGTFDDKIDAYLAGTVGLEPRAGADPNAAPLPRGDRAKTEAEIAPEEAAPELATSGAPTRNELEIIEDDLSEPIELPLKSRTGSDDRTRPIELPMKGSHVQVEPPAGPNDMAAAVAAANAAPPSEPEPPPPAKARVSTAQKVSRSGGGPTPPAGTPRPAVRPAATPGAAPRVVNHAAPVIDITEEEISTRLRMPRDTAVESLPDDIDSTMPVQTARPAAHNAASLPAKPGAARPSMSPPIVTRPAPDSPRKRPGDSEAVEIYQPAPPSVEPPPGERSERAGTYSVSRKSGDGPIREKTGRIAALNPSALGLNDPTAKSAPVPAGLARPGSAAPGPRTPTGDTGRTPPLPGARDPRVPGNVQREPTPGTSVPRTATPPPPPTPRSSGTPQPVPPRVTAPIQNRTSTPANPQANSGVVMTRPAVIVGAPAKPVGSPPTPQRVRKAREEEGRGFGQGLISEKSLDEVILAYLSEDAEDK